MFTANARVASGCVVALALTSALLVACGGASGGVGSGGGVTPPPLPPSSISYVAPAITFTAGVAAQTLTPTASGGAVSRWTISPALPAGLSFSAANGSISGTPSAASAASTYKVSAQNGGGSSSVSLTLTIEASPLLELGHNSAILLARFNGSSVLTEDDDFHWVLWSYAAGTMLASGDSTCPSTDCYGRQYADLQGATAVIKQLNGFEVHAASDGQLLSTISAAEASVSWWELATDGSYIVAGGPDGLSVWSPTGQELVTRSGDYSEAFGFAAPGLVRIAVGPEGANVIETLSVPGGVDSISSAFNGTFNAWFLDGSAFFSSASTTLLIYSPQAVQEALVPGSGGPGTPATSGSPATGVSQWFWSFPSPENGPPSAAPLDIYSISSPLTPAASYSFGTPGVNGSGGIVIPSGYTLGVLITPDGVHTSQVSLIDLSGAAPTKSDYMSPLATLDTYAAASASQWVLTTAGGVLIDGASLAGTPRLFNYGQVLGLAGSSSQLAIATASGQILYFNAATLNQEGTIPFFGSQLALSSDGSTLGAVPDDIQDFTLNIYSLPSGSLQYSWPGTSTTGSGTLCGISFFGSGADTLLTQTLPGLFEVTPPARGASVFSNAQAGSCANFGRLRADPLRVSPDGTLFATSNVADPEAAIPVGGSVQIATNLYQGNSLVTALLGWPVGWLDNGQLLVSTYVSNFGGIASVYQGCAYFGSAGTKVGSCTLPEVLQFQTLSSDSIYVGNLNSIVTVSTGATTWTSGNSQANVGTIVYSLTPWGVLAGSYVVFVSGAQVLAQSQ